MELGIIILADCCMFIANKWKTNGYYTKPILNIDLCRDAYKVSLKWKKNKNMFCTHLCLYLDIEFGMILQSSLPNILVLLCGLSE